MKIRHFFSLLIVFISFITNAQNIDLSMVDEVVEKTLETFNVPGIAVGIVHKDEVVLAKGYGIANINTGEKVNSSTNFGIASNSKAFTTTAIALLIDQGKINWDRSEERRVGKECR